MNLISGVSRLLFLLSLLAEMAVMACFLLSGYRDPIMSRIVRDDSCVGCNDPARRISS